jgi:phosphatidylserine/phosphatidylglycerophosphate/cardiolipin synthase-like enzyme
MKSNRKWFWTFGIAVGICGVAGTFWSIKNQPSSSVNRTFAGAPAESTAPAEPVEGSDEFLTAEQKARKIEVCGAESLTHNTLADYPKTPTPYFPAYSRMLADPHEALLAKVALIQAAQKSIDVSTYIFSSDASSNTYIDELNKAIARGVNVRFMVDAGGSMALALKDFYNPLRALLYEGDRLNEAYKNGNTQVKPGSVNVVVFRPLFHLNTVVSTVRDRFLLMENLNTETSDNIDRRSHDKIIIIDKEDRSHTYAIVGGRNIDNSYYGVPHVDEKTYEDMELLVKDDVSSKSHYTIANTLESHFQDLFCAKGNRWLPMPQGKAELISDVESVGRIKDVGPELNGSLDKLLALDNIREYYNRIWGSPESVETAMQYFDSGMTKSKISPASEEENFTRTFKAVVGNPDSNYVEPSDNGDSIYGKFLEMTKAAKKTIDICTPYIFLPPSERDCLKAWVMEDDTRHIRILSNSVATSDSAAAMETFDTESAPKMLEEGAYHCGLVDKSMELAEHMHLEGQFKNVDSHGNPRIEVLELGRLDNKMFAGNTIDGKAAVASAYYGKLHAKFAIVDGMTSWVGSDNFDERSRHINSETAIFVRSPKIASDLTNQFNQLAARSYHFGEDDWKVMREQKQVKRRLETMRAVEELSKHFPSLGFGN